MLKWRRDYEEMYLQVNSISNDELSPYNCVKMAL